ncbi:hypothetical protein M1M38_gp044 [Halorubrum tailed virus 27]|uniref:Uncharacterized protein n=1 Tax=Halorubrum tailed virus 27 TaxID=2878008 RepID=A0AAE8XYR8_9CAUD|nr:hypothetical protein M1M38_gp044 [Halorubrum tailed virus 27]UBF22737.1 hypothetical protein HRTV-27_gp44 [Halorubrum tailed virus 27]
MCKSMFDSLIENECVDLLTELAEAIEEQRATVRSYSMTHDTETEQTTALRNVVIEVDGSRFQLEVRS